MEGATVSIVSQITGVFSSITDWIATSLPDFVAIFYDSTKGLTFIGTLAVVGLGISVFFLLMGLIQNFLHLRG